VLVPGVVAPLRHDSYMTLVVNSPNPIYMGYNESMHLILYSIGCPSCNDYYNHYVTNLSQNNKSLLIVDIQACVSLMRAIENHDYEFHGSI
jgi:hypothetical protein